MTSVGLIIGKYLQHIPNSLQQFFIIANRYSEYGDQQISGIGFGISPSGSPGQVLEGTYSVVVQNFQSRNFSPFYGFPIFRSHFPIN